MTSGGVGRRYPPPVLDDHQRLACLRLIRSENVGPATFRALINHFGGARAALEALPELSRRGGRRTAIRVCSEAEAEAELKAARRIGARPVFTIEPGYPAALAVVEQAPPLLYVKGDDRLLNRPSIAIVGSRSASAAGQQFARQLAAGLERAGYIIASGLALGIDTAAHHAALETGTIAVLAGGLDVIYPPQNADLHRAIGERGCLVSEMPPGFKPRGTDFPRREQDHLGLVSRRCGRGGGAPLRITHYRPQGSRSGARGLCRARSSARPAGRRNQPAHQGGGHARHLRRGHPAGAGAIRSGAEDRPG